MVINHRHDLGLRAVLLVPNRQQTVVVHEHELHTLCRYLCGRDGQVVKAYERARLGEDMSELEGERVLWPERECRARGLEEGDNLGRREEDSREVGVGDG